MPDGTEHLSEETLDEKESEETLDKTESEECYDTLFTFTFTLNI